MPDQFALYLSGTIIIAALAIAYWSMPAHRSLFARRPRDVGGLLAVSAAGIGLCLWSVSLERGAFTFEKQSGPIAIAVAFDLSPSMLAIPHPDLDDDYLPRFERGKTALLELLRALEEQGEPVILSVIGFTKRANIIMGWDRSIAQVRDILEFAVSPDLFGSSGTSFEAAAKSLDDVFRMLPVALQASSRKLAIVVSDGEDTMRASSFAYAEEQLAEVGFDTIALQTGSLDLIEGVPTYGRVGEFTGFRSMGGDLYTEPNVAAMHAIAEASGSRGLYVRAEAPDAAERMLEYVIGGDPGRAPTDAAWLSTFGMFAVVSLLCALILR